MLPDRDHAPDAAGLCPDRTTTPLPVAKHCEPTSADYVRGLREAAAAHRINAKRIDGAALLVAAHATADGRVDPKGVARAIADLIAAKPYLA